jgi:predicted nucleotidyltransferase
VRRTVLTDLVDIIGSEKCMQLLKFIVYLPEGEFYQSEISRISGLSINTSKKWLGLLVEYGILNKTKKAGHIVYNLDLEHPFVKQLKILMNIARAYEAIRNLSSENFEVYLFGSVARGEDTEKSDLDILIIGAIDNNTLVELADKINKVSGREVNPVRFNPMEYAELSRKDKAFYEHLERDKIRLI